MARTSKSKAKKVTGRKTATSGKGATILGLLHRKDGATLGDLIKATGWQPHSVRGFLSAHIGKKLGLKLGIHQGRRRSARVQDRVVRSLDPPIFLPPSTMLGGSLTRGPA